MIYCVDDHSGLHDYYPNHDKAQPTFGDGGDNNGCGGGWGTGASPFGENKLKAHVLLLCVDIDDLGSVAINTVCRMQP